MLSLSFLNQKALTFPFGNFFLKKSIFFHFLQIFAGGAGADNGGYASNGNHTDDEASSSAVDTRRDPRTRDRHNNIPSDSSHSKM